MLEKLRQAVILTFLLKLLMVMSLHSATQKAPLSNRQETLMPHIFQSLKGIHPTSECQCTYIPRGNQVNKIDVTSTVTKITTNLSCWLQLELSGNG